MFKWLAEHGYARDSAEGQMREMAHRAVSGQYPKTRNALMTGAFGPGTTNMITAEFENPKVVNARHGAVAQAYRAAEEAKNAQYEAEAAARRHAFVVEMETKRKDAESRAAKPEVAPQKPVHVPPIKIPDQWEDRPKYDYSKPGHPLIETTPKSSSPTTPQAPPHAVSPRPIGHTTTSSSVRHGDVSLNPKTTINVTTPGDAGAAARAIAGVQTRVNADAIRNMQGAAH